MVTWFDASEEALIFALDWHGPDSLTCFSRLAPSGLNGLQGSAAPQTFSTYVSARDALMGACFRALR